MKNQFNTIGKIKKNFPLFFNKDVMEGFKSRIEKPFKVLDNGTYFVTSEIYESFYKYNSFNERLYPESKRVYNIRFAHLKDNQIYKVKQFKTMNEVLIYFDKLEFNNGGYRISQHDANLSKINILKKREDYKTTIDI